MTLDNVTVTFHYGSGFELDGFSKKPFAKLQIDSPISRELIDQICKLVRDNVNQMGECCSIKIQSESWDC